MKVCQPLESEVQIAENISNDCEKNSPASTGRNKRHLLDSSLSLDLVLNLISEFIYSILFPVQLRFAEVAT